MTPSSPKTIRREQEGDDQSREHAPAVFELIRPVLPTWRSPPNRKGSEVPSIWRPQYHTGTANLFRASGAARFFKAALARWRS